MIPSHSHVVVPFHSHMNMIFFVLNHIATPCLSIVWPIGRSSLNNTPCSAEVAAEADQQLRRMLGAGVVPSAIGCRFSAWGSDPYAQGSWCFPVAGACDSDAAGSMDAGDGVHQTWADRAVLYAGECVSIDHAGTAHGAYAVGQVLLQLNPAPHSAVN